MSSSGADAKMSEDDTKMSEDDTKMSSSEADTKMSSSEAETKMSEAQKKLREAGIVDIILQMLDIHGDNVVACKSAIAAIAALAKDDINRELLIDSGIIERVVETMTKHIENSEIINACFNALKEMNVELVPDDDVKG